MGDEAVKRGKGRPRGFDEDAALEAAMVTFWRQGYGKTSLDDLVAATGASRASLYQVFGDKRALFIRALDLYGERFSERMRSIMNEEPNGKRALEKILAASADRLTSTAGPPGCLRCDATVELMGTDEALDAAIAQANASYLANIKKLCARAEARGEISKERAKRLPILITTVIAGMVTLARGGASRRELNLLIEQVLENWSDE